MAEYFEEEFNVETRSSDWARCIRKLRNQLGARLLRNGSCNSYFYRFSHNCPILCSQESSLLDEPQQHRWFDIVLRTNDHRIRLRIRQDNLYLDGYQMEDPQPTWFEFGNSNSNSHRILGSNFLGFDGSYNALERAANERMEHIRLGRRELRNAVNCLANRTTSSQQRAKSLIVVIQMFCESIRFNSICDNITRGFINGFQITPAIRELVNVWGNFSALLLQADANAEFRFYLPPLTYNTHIRTLEDVAEELGMVLEPLRISRGSRRLKRMANNDEQFHYVRPLVEVFSVLIKHADRENPGGLYGTITVTDGLGFQYIYDRRKDNPESIKPGDNASLTGPARCISAYGSFTIKVLLTDKDSWSWGDEVSNGEISWNVYNTENEYDKPLFHEVCGRYGSVTVNYIVLSYAVAASVKVRLINREGERFADVYGQLTATIDNFGDSESVLFQKAKDEHIKVSPEQLIPLSRSIVAVPLNSSLLVRANLCDYNKISSDDEIAKDTADFPAQLSGTIEKSIFGKHGEIRVKVTWKCDI